MISEHRDIWSRSRNTYKLFKVIENAVATFHLYHKHLAPLYQWQAVMKLWQNLRKVHEKTLVQKRTAERSYGQLKTHTPRGSSSNMTEFALLRKTEPHALPFSQWDHIPRLLCLKKIKYVWMIVLLMLLQNYINWLYDLIACLLLSFHKHVVYCRCIKPIR